MAHIHVFPARSTPSDLKFPLLLQTNLTKRLINPVVISMLGFFKM